MDAGVIIAKMGGNGSFKINMKWKREDDATE